MATDSHEKTYESLLLKSQSLGETEELAPNEERRKHPRIHVDAAEINVDTDSWIFVINLSISGIAFFTDSEFQVGQEVTISMGPDVSVRAKVVEFEPEGLDPTSLMGQYRVCCEFNDPQEGMDFLVRIKAREEGELDQAVS